MTTRTRIKSAPPPRTASELARRVRDHIRARGLTAYRVALDAGVAYGTVCRFMRDEGAEMNGAALSRVLFDALGAQLKFPPAAGRRARQ